MPSDARNHFLTAANDNAAQAVSLAMENYSQRKSDVVPQLLKSIDYDPDCSIAHATFGLMLHGAKHKAFQPKVAESLANAKDAAAKTEITEREKLYLRALESASVWNLHDTVSCYEEILKQHPTDLFALNLCQSELFWLGEMDRSAKASASVESSWNSTIPGYSEFLAVRAFDLEELNQFKAAEAAGRESVELNSTNVWATHAVAHVLLMQGRFDEGVQWIGGLQDNWGDVNQMQLHLWWHKCLFHLERGEHDVILAAYDEWVRNRELPMVQAMPDLYIDLQNGSSLLWRLENAGVNVGERWNEMAALVIDRLDDMASPFTSAHFAVILAAVGDYENCQRLIEAMREFAATRSPSLSHRYDEAAIPAAIAATAHRRGEYQTVVDTLMPARHSLWMMGGSHAQQDLFFQMLVDATVKLERADLAQSLLQEIEKIGFVEPAQRIAYQSAGNLK